jgi:hypothetical protein
MSETLQIALIAGLATLGVGLITSFSALSGVRLGSRLQRENEAEKWRREQCLQAYTELLGACSTVFLEATRAYVMDMPEKEAKVHRELILTKVSEMLHFKDRVSLIGPDDLELPLRELTMHYHQEVARRAITPPKPSDDEWDKILTKAARLLGIVTTKARNDLGVNPPRIIVERWAEAPEEQTLLKRILKVLRLG